MTAYLSPALSGGRAYLAPDQPPANTVTPPVTGATVTSVVVLPATASVADGGTLQLSAIVNGTGSPSQGVVWTTPVGSITAAGLLTAPAALYDDQSFTVTATSTQDPRFSGFATIVVPAKPDERNYAWLQAQIADWLHRTDLTLKIPTFIAMAEARINRIASVRGMELEASLLFPVGVGAVRLPSGFDTPLAAWVLTSTGRRDLSAVVPEQLPGTTTPGYPQYWAISGAYMALDCPSDAARTIALRYRGLVRLSDAAPSNSILVKYPDVYLYGSLMEGAMYLRDQDSVTLWAPMFDAAIKEMNRNESRSRAVAPLRSEISQLIGRCDYDIYRGF